MLLKKKLVKNNFILSRILVDEKIECVSDLCRKFCLYHNANINNSNCSLCSTIIYTLTRCLKVNLNFDLREKDTILKHNYVVKEEKNSL